MKTSTARKMAVRKDAAQRDVVRRGKDSIRKAALQKDSARTGAPRAARGKGPFAPIDEAIAAIRAGRMIVVVDDEDRENEGDLTIAAEKVTPDAINFMARYGCGLICVAMTEDRLEELDLPQMVGQNTARLGTAFCVSIDAKGVTSTGVSASDRAATVLAMVIGMHRGGARATFTVRKVSFGQGVERIFPLHSPIIDKIDVVRTARVRRAKLYFLRELKGKAARMKDAAKKQTV